ncbi:MAG: hypothetical protein EPN89_09795 [Methylovulum sp.]|nr:MAG: hypothetical protein EPN89_09795 [Methylovulum sp.]
MATPIKDTPVLTGKDARRFEAWMKENEGKKVSPEEYARIKDAGKKMRVFNNMEDYERYCASSSGH